MLAIPLGAKVVPSAAARSKETITGPTAAVGVGVGRTSNTPRSAVTSATVIAPSPLTSPPGQAPWPSPNSAATKSPTI